MSESTLLELAVKYFKIKDYIVHRDVLFEGKSGLIQKFDLLVERADDRHLVSIKDWKRTVGVNMIVKIDKASLDVGVPNPIVIAPTFSDHAKAYANRQRIKLIVKRNILDELRKRV